MRTTSLAALALVGACAWWLPACKSGSGGAAPDASGAGGGAGTSGSAGAGGSGTGSGGITGGGGAAGGTAVRDCLPACIVALRGTCERPAVDGGGTCFAGPGGHCYANGVRETTTFADGGQLNVYTKPDGQTICYQVFSESGGVSHFRTPAGDEVAQGRSGVDGGYEVTCDGMTVVVDLADPSCATQNSTNCIAATAGECP